eukprot:7521134-Prorocentrum_lima.AAC.1
MLGGAASTAIQENRAPTHRAGSRDGPILHLSPARRLAHFAPNSHHTAALLDGHGHEAKIPRR